MLEIHLVYHCFIYALCLPYNVKGNLNNETQISVSEVHLQNTIALPQQPLRQVQQFFGWATRPHPSITGRDQRRQVRLLLSMNLVFFVGLCIVVADVILIHNPSGADSIAAFWALVAMICLSGMNLVLGKQPRFRLAAYATVITVGIGGYALAFTIQTDYAEFLVLTSLISTMMAALFLSLRTTALYALGNILFFVLAASPLRVLLGNLIFQGQIAINEFSSFRVVVVSVILAAISAVILVFIRTRDLLEQDRREALAARMEQERIADEMQTKANVRSQFLANMSHELRTPLNVIIGYTSSMLTMPQMYKNQPLPEVFRADMALIQENGQYLLGLINDVLELSKMEAGKFELDRSAVNLVEVMKGVIATSIGLLKSKPVQIRPDFPEDLPRVWADPLRVRQILLNLMSNAVKFTESGSVTLSACAEGDNIRIAVSDTGIGIPANALAAIFDRFQQVRKNVGIQGTGLGLDISQRLANMHGSEITVESTVGRGSTFAFTLPLATAHQLGLDKHMVTTPQARQQQAVQFEAEAWRFDTTYTVLLVEDDSESRALVRRTLESAAGQYVVIDAQDGAQALDLATGMLPDLIVLDIDLPDMSGWDVLTKLKADTATAAIPTLVLTATPDDQRAAQTGVLMCLGKPIEPTRLLEKIELTFANLQPVPVDVPTGA
jgi:signal transduction histidine kinase/ActR/RegA family two-component response regulator